MQFGYEGVADLAKTQINLQSLHDTMPPYLLRYVPENPSILDTLHAAQKAAIEAKYVTRALDISRRLIEEKMPDVVPQENTVALMNASEKNHAVYYGRFGGQHLIQFRGKDITLENIVELNPNSEIVRAAIHELFHQKHAEIQGAHKFAFDIPTLSTTDPWEMKKIADQSLQQIAEGSPAMKLQDQLRSHLIETIAYLGEAKITGILEDTRVALFDAHPDWPDWQDTEHLWVSSFAASAPKGQRNDVIQRLMEVDLDQIAHLSSDEVQNVINNPYSIFDL